MTPPSSQTIAAALAEATRLAVVNRATVEERDERIDIATIGESLFDFEREANTIALSSFVPAHPYLWENLDRVLSELGGNVAVGETLWQPQPRFKHLRRPWQMLPPAHRFLLRIPTIGAMRWLDRFV